MIENNWEQRNRLIRYFNFSRWIKKYLTVHIRVLKRWNTFFNTFLNLLCHTEICVAHLLQIAIDFARIVASWFSRSSPVIENQGFFFFGTDTWRCGTRACTRNLSFDVDSTFFERTRRIYAKSNVGEIVKRVSLSSRLFETLSSEYFNARCFRGVRSMVRFDVESFRPRDEWLLVKI